MDPNIEIPFNATRGVWLTCKSISGGKDWLCFAVPKGIVTFWGKTGQVKQSHYKQFGNYDALVKTKMQKGYCEVATWSKAAGWVQTAVVPAKPTPKENMEVNRWVSSADAQDWF